MATGNLGPALPYANNLKFDDTLSFSDDNYREKLENETEDEEERSKEERMESVIEYPKPLIFARFATAAYQDWKKEDESQSDYDKRLQLPQGWKLLTSARGLALKGAIYGYFGAAYWQPDHRRVVIAHRGTIPTNLDAVWADLKGIAGHSYVQQMSAACTFALQIHDAVKTVERKRHTTFEIFFTGHSLGAWLAQVTTFSLKYLRLFEGAFVKNKLVDDGYHARAVVFDSPGCEDTIRKMITDLDVRYAGKSTSAARLDVTSYLSSPNFVNCCNRHIGKLYRLFPQIESEGYVKYTLSSHSMKGILDTFILWDKPKLKEVVDWPQIKIDLWQYKMWKLPDKILGKEYENFFQFATDLNDHDPSEEEIKIEFNSSATNDDNTERFVRVRYQTKPAPTNECTFNVFTDSELEFLQRFQQLKIIPNSLFEGEEISEEFQSKIAEKINNLIINTKDKTIRLREEENFKVFQIIPYVKTLLRLFPDLKDRARLALTDFEVRKQIYKDITKEYRRKMEYLTNALLPLPSDWPDFGQFLDNESSIFQVFAKYGTDAAMAKVLKIIETKETGFVVFAFELQNLALTETFFHLTDFLKSDSLIDVLLLVAIECKTGTFKNVENFLLVKKVQEEISARSNVKLFIITDAEDKFNLDDDSVPVSHGGIMWDDLTKQAQTEIMSENIITFQGNPEKINLINFMTNFSDCKEILDPETLMKFLKKEDVFVGQRIPAYQNFYVPRKFKYNPYVKEKIFDEARDDDVVAVWANDQISFSTVTTKLEDHWKRRRFQIVKSDEDFKSLCENNSGKNIHCLKFESNLLVWHKTEGSLNLIRQNIRDSGPEAVLENIEDFASKTLIISDVPGMGKSTVLAVLAQKLKDRTPRHWVIRINLNDCAKTLYDAKNSNIKLKTPWNAAEFLSGQLLACSENTKLISVFERKLFEKSLTLSGGMVLILDAFDEISPDYEEIVLQLVKLLNESRLEKLVLSTRPHTKEQLEDQLGTLSYTMVPFSRYAQKMLLKQFSKNSLIHHIILIISKLADEGLDQPEESISTEEDQLGATVSFSRDDRLMFFKQCVERILNDFDGGKIGLNDFFDQFSDKLSWLINAEDLLRSLSPFSRVRLKMFFKELWKNVFNYLAVGQIGLDDLAEQCIEFISAEKDHLGTSLRTMVPFSRDRKIKQSLKKPLDNVAVLNVFFDNFGDLCAANLEKFISAEGDFWGLPLQCELLADCTLDLIMKRKRFEKLSLMELYETFVRRKMDIYQKDKNLQTEGKILARMGKDLMGTEILKAHRQYALRLLLSREKWDELDYPEIEDDQVLIDTAVRKVGLMLKTGDNPQFVHRNFAEFFVVDYILYLARNTTKKASQKLLILSREVLLKPEFGVARTFLDDLINNEKNTEEITVFLNSFVQIAAQNWTHNNSLCLSRLGNTVVHQLLFGDNFFVLDTLLKMLTDEYGPEIVKSLIDTPEACTEFLLHIAVAKSHLNIVRLLLEKGANINACKDDNETPFFIASHNGHLEIASLLHRKITNIKAFMNIGASPLFIASHNGHLEMARLLLEKGANINACTNNGVSPLFIAAQKGHLEITRLLLEKDANINACWNTGATPLFMASQHGHLEIARLLLEKDANINACWNTGATPLFMASLNGHLEIARLLLEKDANINACWNTGETPLLMASLNGHLEIARLLLEKDANINACRNTGATPLFVASLNGHLEIARLLLEKDANINACRNTGVNPLLIASRNGHMEMARLLLENGADINAQVDDGWTSLHVASYKGHLDIVKILIEGGAKVDLPDYDGTTPLNVASYNGQLGVAELLVQNEHSVNAANIFGVTPVHSAAGQGQLDPVIFLLENGANIDAVTINDPPVGHEETPLHHAAQEGRTETVHLLLALGANALARNSHDQTPLDLAIIHNHTDVVELLSSL